jgi:uncharacterized membrane protein HdeD (DUF308 family)
MKKIKTWWLLLIAGLTLIFIGTFSFIDPLDAYSKVVRYSGYILLLNGSLLSIVSVLHNACKMERRWLFIESVVDFSFAIILLFNPIFTFIAYSFIIGYWILIMGIIKILASFTLVNQVKGWGFILLTGFLATTFGFLIVNLPLEKADNFTSLMGFFCLTMGTLTVFDAFRFRKLEDALNLFF